jgi:predicted CoA-binding protein
MTNSIVKELLLQGFDLIQIRNSLEDGEYLALIGMTKAEAEEAHNEARVLQQYGFHALHSCQCLK